VSARAADARVRRACTHRLLKHAVLEEQNVALGVAGKSLNAEEEARGAQVVFEVLLRRIQQGDQKRHVDRSAAHRRDFDEVL
jgi:hypothetical protein